MTAYYNEIDPFAAQWLRNLIAGGKIASGDVDERSIADVQPSDLAGYRQCHFFAGIGVWSYALRCAGWSDDRAAWTGSCPCQPFSDAGAKAGFADARHLWPAWFRLIRECRPVMLFGEQVASRDALAWFDLVSTDLEGAGYAVGTVDIPAGGVGAPHIRQRLWFVADAKCGRSGARRAGEESGRASVESDRLGDADRMANSDQERRDGVNALLREDPRSDLPETSRGGAVDVMGDASGARSGWDAGGIAESKEEVDSERERAGGVGDGSRTPGPVNGFWRGAEWISCRDGKARPVEPGVSPLVVGASGRVGKLRAYGNAIVAPVAVEVVRAYMDTRAAA